jgi:hypothetical protein
LQFMRMNCKKIFSVAAGDRSQVDKQGGTRLLLPLFE